jgi:hypothetical protein
MAATEKLQAVMSKFVIWKKRAEANILANFQALEEVIYEDRAGVQNSLSIPLEGEACEYFRTVS